MGLCAISDFSQSINTAYGINVTSQIKWSGRDNVSLSYFPHFTSEGDTVVISIVSSQNPEETRRWRVRISTVQQASWWLVSARQGTCRVEWHLHPSIAGITWTVLVMLKQRQYMAIRILLNSILTECSTCVVLCQTKIKLIKISMGTHRSDIVSKIGFVNQFASFKNSFLI